MSRSARRAARAKAHRLATEQAGKVDCSSYGPEEDLKASVKTGMRPVSRRAYKAGGKVEGAEAPKNAGKKQRASGGKALVNDFVNRNDKDANEAREGVKHTGGLKRGGRAAKASGGNAGDEVPSTMFNMQPVQSRMVKAAGLKAGGAAKRAFGGPATNPPKPKPSPKPTDDGWDDPDGGAPTPPAPKKAGGRIGKSVGGDIALGLASPMGLGLSKLIGGGDKDDDTGKKRGGSVSDGEAEGMRPKGGRLARKSGGGNWIKDATKHPGALHRELHFPEGKKIPAAKLEKAEHSKNPTEAKRARLAETLGRMHRATGGAAEEMYSGRSNSGSHKRSGGKDKTNINIVIATGPRPGQPEAPVMPPSGGPGGVPPMGPPPGAAMASPPPVGAPAPMGPPPGGPLPMPRKTGGRAYKSYKDMDAGAESGLGRLEKTEIAKRNK